MQARTSISKQTRNNWFIDSALFTAAIAAGMSGIYFLVFPSGYHGGRNPFYNISILFTRHSWSDIHTWTSILMIVAVMFHIAIHWKWVKSMAMRIFKELFTKSGKMNPRGKFNLAVNLAIAVSFFISAISGTYFLIFTKGETFILTRLGWDMLHTWSSIGMIIAAILHFAIHWHWVTKVTLKIYNALPVHLSHAKELSNKTY
jgi:hypothetical protein